MAFRSVGETLRDMEPGSHAVLIYDTPENKRDILFRHLLFGGNEERLVYVCSEETPARIRDEMKKSALDVDGLEGKGLLSVLDYNQAYIVGGKVNVGGIVDGFSKLSNSSVQGGLKGVRAAGEMSCFFRQGKVDDLIAYERALDRRFSFPGKGICAYNMVEMYNSGHLEEAFPIMRAHGLVFLTGPNGNMVLEPEKVRESHLRGVAEARSSEISYRRSLGHD
jgi:hypothetical protein